MGGKPPDQVGRFRVEIDTSSLEGCGSGIQGYFGNYYQVINNDSPIITSMIEIAHNGW